MSVDKALRQSMQDQVKEKVLWESASPSSTFPQQNVTVADLADYDQFSIEGKYLNDNYDWTEISETTGETYGAINMVYGYSNHTMTSYRPFTINKADSRVEFGQGYNSTSTKDAANNNAAIPLRIIGKKIIGGGGYRLIRLLTSLFERRCAA